MAQKNNNVIPMTFDDAFYRKMAKNRSLNKENINELLNTLKKC